MVKSASGWYEAAKVAERSIDGSDGLGMLPEVPWY
jgi:hypothetical protein